MEEEITVASLCGYSASAEGWVTKWETSKDGVQRPTKQVFVNYKLMPGGNKMTASDIIAIARERYGI